MKYWSQLEELKGAKVEVVQVAFPYKYSLSFAFEYLFAP